MSGWILAVILKASPMQPPPVPPQLPPTYIICKHGPCPSPPPKSVRVFEPRGRR